MPATDDRACPYCKRSGALAYDFASKGLRCGHCFTAGISEESLIERTADTPEASVTRLTSGADEVSDAWVDENGVRHHYKLTIPKLKEAEAPVLYVDVNWCEFHRQRFAAQAQKDRRWGRDHLRRRGFVVVGRQERHGDVCKVWSNDELEG